MPVKLPNGVVVRSTAPTKIQRKKLYKQKVTSEEAQIRAIAAINCLQRSETESSVDSALGISLYKATLNLKKIAYGSRGDGRRAFLSELRPIWTDTILAVKNQFAELEAAENSKDGQNKRPLVDVEKVLPLYNSALNSIYTWDWAEILETAHNTLFIYGLGDCSSIISTIVLHSAEIFYLKTSNKEQANDNYLDNWFSQESLNEISRETKTIASSDEQLLGEIKAEVESLEKAENIGSNSLIFDLTLHYTSTVALCVNIARTIQKLIAEDFYSQLPSIIQNFTFKNKNIITNSNFASLRTLEKMLTIEKISSIVFPEAKIVKKLSKCMNQAEYELAVEECLEITLLSLELSKREDFYELLASKLLLATNSIVLSQNISDSKNEGNSNFELRLEELKSLKDAEKQNDYKINRLYVTLYVTKELEPLYINNGLFLAQNSLRNDYQFLIHILKRLAKCSSIRLILNFISQPLPELASESVMAELNAYPLNISTFQSYPEAISEKFSEMVNIIEFKEISEVTDEPSSYGLSSDRMEIEDFKREKEQTKKKYGVKKIKYSEKYAADLIKDQQLSNKAIDELLLETSTIQILPSFAKLETSNCARKSRVKLTELFKRAILHLSTESNAKKLLRELMEWQVEALQEKIERSKETNDNHDNSDLQDVNRSATEEDAISAIIFEKEMMRLDREGGPILRLNTSVRDVLSLLFKMETTSAHKVDSTENQLIRCIDMISGEKGYYIPCSIPELTSLMKYIDNLEMIETNGKEGGDEQTNQN